MRFALLLLAILPGCAGHRTGWPSRGRYEVLHESASVQIRRSGQKLDPATGEIVLAWVGARTPEGHPGLVACELTVFDDRDGDGEPDVGEVVSLRENRETTRKVLYGDVRARAEGARRLRARIVASTPRERCVAVWALAAD
jgi:hypothetical protein